PGPRTESKTCPPARSAGPEPASPRYPLRHIPSLPLPGCSPRQTPTAASVATAPLRSEGHTTSPVSPAASADATAPCDCCRPGAPVHCSGALQSAPRSSLGPAPPPVQGRGGCPPVGGTPAPPTAHCFRSD